MTYDETRADFEFLETLCEVVDMVEIDAGVTGLMRNPTKRKAADLYLSAIGLWFQENGRYWQNSEEVSDIADRYGIAF